MFGAVRGTKRVRFPARDTHPIKSAYLDTTRAPFTLLPRCFPSLPANYRLRSLHLRASGSPYAEGLGIPSPRDFCLTKQISLCTVCRFDGERIHSRFDRTVDGSIRRIGRVSRCRHFDGDSPSRGKFSFSIKKEGNAIFPSARRQLLLMRDI